MTTIDDSAAGNPTPSFAHGNWTHLFGDDGAPGRQALCRILVDLTTKKLLEAQEWTGARYEEVYGARAKDLENSVIDVNEAHENPLEFGLDVASEPPVWSALKRGEWESIPMSQSAQGFEPLDQQYVEFLGIKDNQFTNYSFQVLSRPKEDSKRTFMLKPLWLNDSVGPKDHFVGPVHGPLPTAFFENALRRLGLDQTELIARTSWSVNINSEVPKAFASGFPSWDLAEFAVNDWVKAASPEDYPHEDDPSIVLFRVHLDGAQTDEHASSAYEWVAERALNAPQWNGEDTVYPSPSV